MDRFPRLYRDEKPPSVTALEVIDEALAGGEE